MTQQPPPLQYASGPLPPLPITHLWLKFFIGLLGGCGASVLAWMLPNWDSKAFEDIAPLLLLGLPFVKLVAGVTLTCIRRWRPMGIGLLIALPLGVLILFFGCVANFNAN